jgi:hypothetical protein
MLRKPLDGPEHSSAHAAQRAEWDAGTGDG